MVARVLKLSLVSILLVGCSEPKTEQTIATKFPEKSSVCTGAAIPGQYLVKWLDGRVTVEHAPDRGQMIAAVVKPNLDKIELVEPDILIKSAPPPAALEPNISVDPGWGQKMIHADEVWAQGINGNGILVAVIDSGVDLQHPQIKNQLFVNSGEVVDGIDNDGNGLIDDVTGYDFEAMSPKVLPRTEHGTHVAGIILAQHSAGPVLGLAEGAKLLPLNFMNNNGDGSLGNAVAAIHYAVGMKARVINASWGSGSCSAILRDAISEAEQKGVLFIVAAGNSGANLESAPEYPAALSFANMLTIGASTSRDYMASFSNYSDKLVQLLAPGYNIYSTIPQGQTAIYSGTSMATPFVVGAAALLMSAKPSATPAEIRIALMRGVDSGPFQVESRGRLNIAKSLQALLNP